jgi:hypothetical protein
MTNITAIAQPTAAAIAGFPVHHVVRAARFEAFARGRCFIRIVRFTGIRILLGSVLDTESAPPSRMSIPSRFGEAGWRGDRGGSKAGARGVSDNERSVLTAVTTSDYGGCFPTHGARVSQ